MLLTTLYNVYHQQMRHRVNGKRFCEILNDPKTAKIMDLTPLYYKTLEDLAPIFDKATATRVIENNNTLQRVHSKYATLAQFIDATSPSHIKIQTLIHQSKNWENASIEHAPLNTDQPNKILKHQK